MMLRAALLCLLVACVPTWTHALLDSVPVAVWSTGNSFVPATSQFAAWDAAECTAVKDLAFAPDVPAGSDAEQWVAPLAVTGCDSASGVGAALLWATVDASSRAFTHVATVTPNDGVNGQRFGYGTAISATYVAVGSPWDSTYEEWGGSAYLFVSTNPTDPFAPWVQAAKVFPTTPAYRAWFGSAVAVAGTTLAVGANEESSQAGAVYVYNISHTAPTHATLAFVARLVSPASQPGARFGCAISISGATMAIGARKEVVDTSKGAVHVFDWYGAVESVLVNTSNPAAGSVNVTVWDWHLAASLRRPSQSGRELGNTLSLQGATLCVGAWYSDGTDGNGPTDSGAAFVWQRTSAATPLAFELIASLLPANAAKEDFIGYRVALSPHGCIVGAYLQDANGADSGAAYVFAPADGSSAVASQPGVAGTAWAEKAKLLPVSPQTNQQFGYAVGASGSTFIASGRTLSSTTAYTVQQPVYFQKVNPGDAASYDYYATSVGIFADVAVMGSYKDDDGGTNTGSAYVYVRDSPRPDAGYTFVQKLLPVDADAYDHYAFAVAVGGMSTIIVGAYRDDDQGYNTGAVYTYGPSGGSHAGVAPADRRWVLTDKISVVGSDDHVWFGASVAIDETGSTLVVGAPYDLSVSGAGPGSAYVYSRSRPTGALSNWTHRTVLTAYDGWDYEHFGDSVAISGDVIAVSAPYEYYGGAVYVFGRVEAGNMASRWVTVAKLDTPSAAAGTAGLGWAIDLRDGIIVAGNPFDDEGASDAGTAYVYVSANASNSLAPWRRGPKLVPDDVQTLDYAGIAVGVSSAGFIVVGARTANEGGTDSGTSYLYAPVDPSRPWEAWDMVYHLLPVDSHGYAEFGSAVASDGLNVVIAAHRDKQHASTSGGAAYLLDMRSFVANPSNAATNGIANGIATANATANASANTNTTVNRLLSDAWARAGCSDAQVLAPYPVLVHGASETLYVPPAGLAARSHTCAVLAIAPATAFTAIGGSRTGINGTMPGSALGVGVRAPVLAPRDGATAVQASGRVSVRGWELSRTHTTAWGAARPTGDQGANGGGSGGATPTSGPGGGFPPAVPWQQAESTAAAVATGSQGLFASTARVDVWSCVLRGGVAIEGGAVHVSGSAARLQAMWSTFEDNTALLGGAIRALAGAAVELQTCTLQNNRATATGGGIAVDGGASLVLRAASTSDAEAGVAAFVGNLAADLGGGVYAGLGSSLDMQSGWKLVGNQAMFRGGGISLYGPTKAAITGATFVSNTAIDSGGAIHINAKAVPVTISGCTFRDNCALEGGGAVAVYRSTLMASEWTVAGNSAGQLLPHGNPQSCVARFVDQEAAQALASGTAASGYGGGVWATSGNTTLTSVSAAGNRAVSGATFHCMACKASLSAINATGGVADATGGAVACSNNGIMTVHGGTMDHNLAGSAGGAVAVSDCSTHWSGPVRFANNSVTAAGTAGGGAYVSLSQAFMSATSSAAAVTFAASTAWHSNSAPQGGALAVDAYVGNTTCDSCAMQCAAPAIRHNQWCTQGSTSGVAVWSPRTAFVNNTATLVPASALLYWSNCPPDGTFGSTSLSNMSSTTAAVGGQPASFAFVAGRAMPTVAATGAAWPTIEVQVVDVYGKPARAPADWRVALSVVSVTATDPRLAGPTVPPGTCATASGGAATPSSAGAAGAAGTAGAAGAGAVSAALSGATSASFSTATSATVQGTQLVASPGAWVKLAVKGQPAHGVADLLHVMRVSGCDAGTAPAGTACSVCGVGSRSPNGTQCVPCDPGTYAASPGLARCSPCPVGTFLTLPGGSAVAACRPCFAGAVTTAPGATSDRQCVCRPGFYMKSPGQCQLCNEEQLWCGAVGTTIASLRVRPGWWRVNNQTDVVYKCPVPSLCVGNTPQLNGTTTRRLLLHRTTSRRRVLSPAPHDSMCAAGATGPYCMVCKDGWHANAQQQCVQCPESSTSFSPDSFVGEVVLAALAICVVVGACLCGRRRLRVLHEDARVDVLRSSGRVVLDADLEAAAVIEAYERLRQQAGALHSKVGSIAAKLRVAVSFLQVSSLFPAVFDIPFPDTVNTVMSALNFFNLDIFSTFSAKCSFPWINHYTYLLVWTALPVALTLLLVALHLVASCCARRSTRRTGTPGCGAWVQSRTFPTFMVGIFLIFPAMTARIFQTFPCVTFEDGRSYLQADLSISCQTDTHQHYVLYASVMAGVMVVMIPSFYFVALWRERELLKKAVESRSDEEKAQTQHLAFLVQDYRPHVWYFEVVEMLRKVFLTGVAVLVFNGTLNQIAIGLLVCLASLLLYTHLRPFANAATNTFATLAQVCLLLTLFGGMLFKAAAAVDAAQEAAVSDTASSERRAQQRWLTAAIIVAVNLMVPLVGIWLLVYKHGVQPWRELRRTHPKTSRCGILCMTAGVPEKHAHSIRKCIGVACGCNRRRAARRRHMQQHRQRQQQMAQQRRHKAKRHDDKSASLWAEMAAVSVANPLRQTSPSSAAAVAATGPGAKRHKLDRADRVLSMRSMVLASAVSRHANRLQAKKHNQKTIASSRT